MWPCSTAGIKCVTLDAPATMLRLLQPVSRAVSCIQPAVQSNRAEGHYSRKEKDSMLSKLISSVVQLTPSTEHEPVIEMVSQTQAPASRAE